MIRFRIERLEKQDRRAFDCGNEILNRYLHRQAGQDQRKGYAVCFLAIEDAYGVLAGYYTLSSGAVDLDRLPAETAAKLPRYPAVPVVTLGRLAVDQKYQSTGLGRLMLADAYTRVQKLDIGAFALVVDAIDANAEAFYEHHGFIKICCPDRSSASLFLPIQR